VKLSVIEEFLYKMFIFSKSGYLLPIFSPSVHLLIRISGNTINTRIMKSLKKCYVFSRLPGKSIWLLPQNPVALHATYVSLAKFFGFPYTWQDTRHQHFLPQKGLRSVNYSTHLNLTARGRLLVQLIRLTVNIY
jgi:hypothetical protein